MNKQIVQFIPSMNVDDVNKAVELSNAEADICPNETDKTSKKPLFSFETFKNTAPLPFGQSINSIKQEVNSEGKENSPPSFPSALFQFQKLNEVTPRSLLEQPSQLDNYWNERTDFGRLIMMNNSNVSRTLSPAALKKSLQSKINKKGNQKPIKKLKKEEEYTSKKSGDLPNTFNSGTMNNKDLNKIYSRIVRSQELILARLSVLDLQIRDTCSSFFNELGGIKDMVEINNMTLGEIDSKVDNLSRDIHESKSDTSKIQYQKARKLLDEIFDEGPSEKSLIE